MKTLLVESLEVNKIYHIRNGFAKVKEDLWFNNSKLIDIDKSWEDPTMLTFILDNGKEIVIDGDFVDDSGKHYQVIGKVIV